MVSNLGLMFHFRARPDKSHWLYMPANLHFFILLIAFDQFHEKNFFHEIEIYFEGKKKLIQFLYFMAIYFYFHVLL